MVLLRKIAFFAILSLSSAGECLAQGDNYVRIKGFIREPGGKPIEKAAVTVIGMQAGTYTGTDGSFLLRLLRDSTSRTLSFSMPGFESGQREIDGHDDADLGEIILREKPVLIDEITVTAASGNAGAGLVSIPVGEFLFFPSPSFSIEAMLRVLPGVASGNELTSSYSVRGGNFDENLVYINGVEVYRPFLVRSGQQEGLGSINPDLVGSVTFSPGGFNATYGDKMSSVLDIKYRRPEENRGSASAGLLFNTAHAEGISGDGRISWLTGVRYKSSRLMLKTLDSRGDYEPVFADIQGVVSVKTGRNSELSFLGSFASNTYNFIPRSRESRFGTESEAYRLFVLFEGREKNRYVSRNAALTWRYNPGKVSQQAILSWFGADEKETFDIRGYYSLNKLDKNTGSENFTDTLMNIGTGSFLTHGRNSLDADVLSLSYSGKMEGHRFGLEWGIKSRMESFDDRVREWKMVDSAGYSIPYSSSGGLAVNYFAAGNNVVGKWITESFAGSKLKYGDKENSYIFTFGVRGVHNTFTSEFFVSPRLSFKVDFSGNYSAWIASGLYFQPPFYREMRTEGGTINRDIKTQKSFHTVAGFAYNFKAWERPFVFTAEVYNKKLSDIIPYRHDNVRIVYEGKNIASGFSRGIDIRLNGEFVEGAESWFSLSLMDSKLRIPGVIDGLFPSPSEQTIITNIFFQDYLPGNPTYRAHINISYVTGLPAISPFNKRYDQFYRMPAYRRVDMGMTKVFRNPRLKVLRKDDVFREIIAGIEIFNLLDINNTVSYFWVKTVNNLSGRSRQFAIPDYLTGRSLNLRLAVYF